MEAETKNSIPNSMSSARRPQTENRESESEHGAPSAAYRSSFNAACFFCYSVLACSLLMSFARAELSSNPQDAQTGEIAPTNHTAQEAEKPSQNGHHSASKPSNQLAQRLWQSRISVPENQKDDKGKNELKHLIERLRSVRFEADKQTPEHIIATESVSKTEPNKAVSAPEMPEQPAKKATRSEPEKHPPYEPVSDQTLQILENLSQHPDQLHNPLDLADILFLSGHLKLAGMLYQQALGRMSSDDVGSAQDKAWILFQTGNCLRDDNLTEAGRMYRQLIGQYPNSPWVDLAKARLNLIDWYQTSKPQTLITEYGTEVMQPPGL